MNVMDSHHGVRICHALGTTSHTRGTTNYTLGTTSHTLGTHQNRRRRAGGFALATREDERSALSPHQHVHLPSCWLSVQQCTSLDVPHRQEVGAHGVYRARHHPDAAQHAHTQRRNSCPIVLAKHRPTPAMEAVPPRPRTDSSRERTPPQQPCACTAATRGGTA